MKAVQCVRYGSPDVMRLVDVPQPMPRENEVLIRVQSTAATPSDVAFRSGKPFIARFFSGLLRPKYIPGTEVAGEVTAVGHGVTRFQPGDPIVGACGTKFGAYAEYVCLPEDGLIASRPANMSAAEATHVTDGGLTALVFLRDHARLQPGQSILINGASGSVGAFAVQLAKYYGAVVTGVCSGANAGLVESLGADRVIDYTRHDFTGDGQTYDVIFDAVGKSSFGCCRRSLKPGGVYMTTVPSARILLDMARTKVSGGQRAVFAATGLSQRVENLTFLTQLYEAGVVRSVVDRYYPLEEIVAAHRYVETERKRGEVAIEVGAGR
jgi:NADPH:quinone reductase-like Zn-dependent oxidoreductase